MRAPGMSPRRREGLSVSYALTSPRIAELLRVARGILTGVVAGQAEVLEDLPEPPALVGETGG